MDDSEVYQEALTYDRERLQKLQETGYADAVPQTLAGAVAYVESGRLTARGQAIEMVAKRLAWQTIDEEAKLSLDTDEDFWWEQAHRPSRRQIYRERAEELLKMFGSALTVGEL